MDKVFLTVENTEAPCLGGMVIALIWPPCFVCIVILFSVMS